MVDYWQPPSTSVWNANSGPYWSAGLPNSSSDVVLDAGEGSNYGAIVEAGYSFSVASILIDSGFEIIDSSGNYVSGDVTNNSLGFTLDPDDTPDGTPGGSSLTIGGSLTNSASLNIGCSSLAASSTLTASSFINNLGIVTLTGNGSAQAKLDILGNASLGATGGTLDGSITLAGNALIEFGAGQITTIDANSGLTLTGPKALIALSADASSNSALQGLSLNNGLISLEDGVAISTTGAFTDSSTGSIDIDDFKDGDTGSSFAVGGLLTNAGIINCGEAGVAGATGVDIISAKSLDNQSGGYLSLSADDGNLGELNVTGDVTNDGTIELLGDDQATFGGSMNGAGTVVVGAGASLSIAGSASGGTIEFFENAALSFVAGATPSSTIVEQSTIDAQTADDTITLIGLGEETPNLPHVTLFQPSFTLTASGEVATQLNADGSKIVTTFDVTGQSFTQKAIATDAQGALQAKYFSGVTGQGNLSAFEYLYGGGHVIGTNEFYTGTTGQNYKSEEVDFDGGGLLSELAFTGVTGAAYSSYEYDYVGGVFAASKFTYTKAPTGASYSIYEVDYNQAGAFEGDRFFFTGLTGVGYSNEEEDFNAGGALTRVVLTGLDDELYSSLELDYSAGAYEGYKAFYDDLTGRSYTDEEVDVSASGQLEKVVYSGMKETPYSSVEVDYLNGSPNDTIYDYTNVTGETYYAYQVTENVSGDAQQETFDLNSGGHALLALAAGQTLTSLGLDKMTGDGVTTFVLDAIYGADVITNFNANDTVSLSSVEFAQLKSAIQNGVYSGGNAVLSFSDGDKLTFKDMAQAQLTALSGNFTSHA